MEKVDLSKRVQHFQLIAQEKLQTLICSIPGNNKDLIIEPTLIKPLEYICTAPWLRLKGIQRILKLDACNPIPRLSDDDHVQIYLLRSNNTTLMRVLKQIKHLQQDYTVSRKSSFNTDENIAFKSYHLICVPACFVYFHTLIELEGLHDCICLHRFNWDFLPLDDFVLSMEMPNVFDRTFLKQDCSLLPAVMQSFRIMQLICGHAKLTITYGEHSENILNMLSRMPKLVGRSSEQPDFTNEFNVVLMIDRNKDYVASLLTPVTYSGLLLEVFECNAGFLKLRKDGNKITEQKLSIFDVRKNTKDSVNASDIETSKRSSVLSFRLNGGHDIIYKQNRYKHFGAASSDIRTQAKMIGKEPQKLSNMQLKDMHDYVRRKLPEITDLKEKLLCHLTASEELIGMLGGIYHKVQNLEHKILYNTSPKKSILKEIDELLATDGQRYNTLRLLCLLHACQGINYVELAQFLQNYCNYFGSEGLIAFHQLALAGLLPSFCDHESPSASSTLSAPAQLSVSSPMQKNRTANIFKNMPLNLIKNEQTLFQVNSNRLGLLLTGSESESSDKIKCKESSTMDSVGATTAIKDNNNQTNTKINKLAKCPSYVYNGLYIPLVAQLCSYILKADSTDDLIAKLSVLDDIQMNGISADNYNQSVKNGDLPELLPLNNRNILIYVLGSVSYAEIAACQLIAKLTDSNVFIASDSILSGSDLIATAFRNETI